VVAAVAARLLFGETLPWLEIARAILVLTGLT
jgi:hypothetical protein